MDEHNDAYYHWICYIEHKFIPPAGNYLLHIDHHDDFEFGGYDWDLNKMPDTPKDALDFVDRALGIADFIAPTLWQGIFSTVHIMKNLVPRPLEAAEEFVRLTGGTVLTRGKYIPFIVNINNTEVVYLLCLKLTQNIFTTFLAVITRKHGGTIACQTQSGSNIACMIKPCTEAQRTTTMFI